MREAFEISAPPTTVSAPHASATAAAVGRLTALHVVLGGSLPLPLVLLHSRDALELQRERCGDDEDEFRSRLVDMCIPAEVDAEWRGQCDARRGALSPSARERKTQLHAAASKHTRRVIAMLWGKRKQKVSVPEQGGYAAAAAAAAVPFRKRSAGAASSSFAAATVAASSGSRDGDREEESNDSLVAALVPAKRVQVVFIEDLEEQGESAAVFPLLLRQAPAQEWKRRRRQRRRCSPRTRSRRFASSWMHCRHGSRHWRRPRRALRCEATTSWQRVACNYTQRQFSIRTRMV